MRPPVRSKTFVGRLLRLLHRLIGWPLLLLLGCSGGAPFEHGSPGGSAVAGAQSGAGSIAAAGSPELGGGAGGTPTGGAADAGAPPEPVDLAGAGGGGGSETPVAAPCSRASWGASAFSSAEGEPPANALDGSQATRWASGAPREPGQWFALELGAGTVLQALTLRAASSGDLPATVALELDGAPTDATTVQEPGALTLELATPAPASSARLELTAVGASPAWWTVTEIDGVCQ